MREIKFRAFYKNKMRDVVSIDWRNKFCSLAKGFTEIPLKEVELMQYTGLNDVNGVEIYEGDVVRFDTNVQILESEVTYCHGMFTIKKYGEKIPLFTGLKVVGNKFKNPELLEDN